MARAETTFGGEPNGPVSSEASCGPVSCTLYWIGPGGSDLAPIPASGGSGTITGVTLPAMPDPGQMQVVVLTSSSQGSSASGSTCCSVKEASPAFTIPANQVTTVPLSLQVAATGTAAARTGGTPTSDGVGISLLEPEHSTPLRITENPADSLLHWAPALTAPTSSLVEPIGEAVGYELEARFTFVEAPASVTAPSPTPGTTTPGPAAKGGVKLDGRASRPARGGRILVLGRVRNPPTASTTQTLSLPAAGAAAAARARKPVIIGTGKTTVPAGRSVPLKLTLDAKGRAALAERHALRATLTVVATNVKGESQTLTRRVTIRPRATKAR